MKIAVTGGMGCGKTTVIAALKNLLPSHYFYSYDEEVARMYERDWKFRDELRHHFNTVDRKQVADLVFNHPDHLQTLVRISDPPLRSFLTKVTEQPNVLVEVPMFYEIGGLEPLFEKVIAVWCAEDDQMARIRARDGLSEAAIRAKLSVQMPSREKAKRADFVIDTSDGAVDVSEQLRILLRVAKLS